MKNQNQQQQKNPILNEYRLNNLLTLYIDGVIRGLIALFLFSGIYYIFFKNLKIPIFITMAFIIVLSIALSPIFSRIRVGHIIQKKYMDFLNKKW